MCLQPALTAASAQPKAAESFQSDIWMVVNILDCVTFKKNLQLVSLRIQISALHCSCDASKVL